MSYLVVCVLTDGLLVTSFQSLSMVHGGLGDKTLRLVGQDSG